jgi:hypothetical protein
MPMSSPLMPADYHRDSVRSGDISVLQYCQPDVSDALVLPKFGLSMEKDGNTVIAKPAIGTPRHQILSISAADLADDPSPTAAMTDSRPLMGEGVAWCHYVPFAPEPGPLGNSWRKDRYFGGPANSGSPVALRPPLARGLPFSTMSSQRMTL